MNSLQQKISSNYGDSPKRLLTHLWFVCLAFGFIHVLVAISVAAVNNQVDGGSKGASFAAIWSLFIVMTYCIFGSHMVFKANPPVILIGFIIGMSFMLSQLFFVLMCVFFTLGSHAKTNKIGTEQANNAFGVFSFLNMLIFAIWACMLSYHRSALSIKGGNNATPSPLPPSSSLPPNTTVDSTLNINSNSRSNYLTSFFTTSSRNEKNNHDATVTSVPAVTANVMINDEVELESIRLDDSQSKHTPSS